MKSGPKASDQVGSDAVVEKILEFCKIARTKKEISEHIGYKNLTPDCYKTRSFNKNLHRCTFVTLSMHFCGGRIWHSPVYYNQG